MSIDISRAKLLIVEDNQGYCDILVKRLNKKGYQEIECAQDEQQAYECLERSHYDVIIADMRLNDAKDGGFQVLDKVEEMRITSIVIILTANDSVADCRRALKTECCWDYICKNAGEGGSPIDAVDKAIQEALAYFDYWGNRKDEKWLQDNLETLRKSHPNKYVAVMNHQVIESADTRQEIDEKVKKWRLPSFIPVIQKIPGELRLFYSYAHKDEALRDEVNKCLKGLQRQKIIVGWHDRNINAGGDWKHEIHTELARADIILLLISFDFINSDYCYELELKQALKRHDDPHDMAVVIPIFLEPTHFTGLPFAKLQGFPSKPITKYENINDALLVISEGIEKTAKNLRQQHEAFFHDKN